MNFSPYVWIDSDGELAVVSHLDETTFEIDVGSIQIKVDLNKIKNQTTDLDLMPVLTLCEYDSILKVAGYIKLSEL